ncbi:MAG: deoxynucleoside kinase [Bacteroidetes bacterium]|nr:MAG: deoxynucleoside kinase [Bacteroidota bacterium]
MPEQKLPYKFITIEGNIGAGKTTLTHMLSKDFNYKIILEEFSDNPFLPFFYKNPERYAFPVELFFMAERHKQLQEELAKKDLFQQSVVADYFFLKTLLFAKNNLNEEEYRLFQRLFDVLNLSFPAPDILVYLHRPVENLLQSIKVRGRAYEQVIKAEYLSEIQAAYFNFFKTDVNFPVLIINLGVADFLREEATYQRIIGLLNREYEVGVHTLDL